MSKYDKEREAMGLQPLASSPSANSRGTSKYAAERDYYKNTEAYNARGAAEMDESRIINESREAALPAPVKSPSIQRMDDNAAKARKLPVIGPVLRGLDAFATNPIVDKVAEIGRSLYVPGAGLSNIAGLTGAAEAGVAKVLPSLGNSLGGRVAQKAISEAAVGAPLGLAQTQMVNPDASGRDLAEGAAIGAAIGGGLGALGKYAGTKLGDAIERWKSFREPIAQQQEVLTLPPGRRDVRYNNALERSNLAPNDAPIVNPYTFELPEATPGTLSKVRNNSDATNALREIDTTLKQLDSGYQKAVNDQFKLLKQQRDTRGGVTQGNIIRDASGDVIDRTGRISNNPQWYQEFYAENGRVPSNKDLYNLAKQHVDDGYADNGVQIPAWAKENDYHSTKEALTSVQNEIKKTLGENSLNITPSKLKDDVLFAKNKPASEAPQVSKYAREREQFLRESEAPTAQTEQADDFIQTKEPRIRDKVYNYLDEAEKAARERLRAKRNTLSSLPLDQYADHAIILAAQIGKGGIKLADATEFLVKEFGEQIRPHAAKILSQARNIAREAERRASKEAQEARTFNESQTGDAASFSGKVSREVKKDKKPFAQRIEKIRTQFIDDLAPLESLEKRVSGSVASAEDSLYKSARLFRGVPEKANQIVKERLSPIIDDLESKGYTTDQLGDYALAVHAKDVNARDIKSGWTNKEIADKIAELGTPEMEAARKALVKIGDDMLEELVNTSVISRNLMESLRERYPNYIPLFRELDDQTVNFADGLSNAMANVTAPIKGLKGSERKVVDPLENMVKNIFQSTQAAERNKVALQLDSLAKKDQDGIFIRRLADKNVIVKLKNGDNARLNLDLDDYNALQKMEPADRNKFVQQLAKDQDAKFIRLSAEPEEVGSKNVVSVLRNGEKVRYEVEPEVYKAMLNLDKESSNMLIKVLQKPASLLRAGATLTPEFSLRNPLRDVAQAFVTSKSGFNPIVDFPVGLIQSISKGDLYKKWINELGAYGNIISNDRQVHREALERVLKEPPSKKFINIVNGKSLIKMLRAISDTTESATKVGEFRAALRQGQSPQEAAFRSRDIMDFGRAGNSIREANKVVAFLNANIQGKSKLIRAFKENPAGFSARAFTAVTVPTIGAFLLQKYVANDAQKQTIDESPQWLKDSFWLLPVPFTDQVARIPKPFDLNVLFSNLPERAMNYIWNNDKEAMDGFVKKSLADSALPGMISGLLPFIEGMSNYSFFMDSSIIPRGEEGRKYSDQYDINTTETAKLIAKGAEKLTGGQGSFKNFSSPRIVDNTIRGLTAGLGQYGTSLIDAIFNGLGLTNNPHRPERGIAQQPLAKAFLVNPTQSGKSTEKLYDLKDKLTREKGSAKLNQSPFADEAKLGFINDQTEAMGSITKNIRAIENDRSLTPKQKRERIEPLLSKRNEIAREAMKRINQQATR